MFIRRVFSGVMCPKEKMKCQIVKTLNRLFFDLGLHCCSDHSVPILRTFTDKWTTCCNTAIGLVASGNSASVDHSTLGQKF